MPERRSGPRVARAWAAWLLAAWLSLFALIGPARAEEDFLPPEQAFRLTIRVIDASHAEIRIAIARGYYAYRDRFRIELDPASARAGARLAALTLPAPSQVKFDPNFDKEVEIWHDQVNIAVALTKTPSGGQPADLVVTYQGCADKGLCYPPMTRTVRLAAGPADQATPPTAPSAPLAPAAKGSAAAPPVPGAEANQPGLGDLWAARDDVNRLGEILARAPLPLLLVGFALLGLSLSLTPCVLPMLPIVSSIVVGQGQIGHAAPPRRARLRGFLLSLAYVLGMAIIYALAGVLAARAGASLGLWLQNPWVIGAFALLLVALALAMFEFYHLQLPGWLRHRLHLAGSRTQGGSLGGAFAIGAVSSVVVGPCVTAPLAGLLSLIAQTGEPVRGGMLLFAMALGMGVPMLLIGVGAASLLPRTGAWMHRVQHVFGAMLIALAIWMLAPVMPARLAHLAWGVYLLTLGGFLGAYTTLPDGVARPRIFWKGLGLSLAVAGGALIWQAAGSDTPPPAIAAQPGTAPVAGQTVAFAPVDNGEALDAAIHAAAQQGRTVMLDFYADWCVSCKEMEALTFPDPRIAPRLSNLVLLRADVTANAPAHQALLKRFGLFGPPGILFFGADGREIRAARVVGFQSAEAFGASLSRAGAR